MTANHALMNLKEACDYLRISKETMYRLVTAEKIAHYRIARKIMFSIGDVNDFILQQKRGTNGKGKSKSDERHNKKDGKKSERKK